MVPWDAVCQGVNDLLIDLLHDVLNPLLTKNNHLHSDEH